MQILLSNFIYKCLQEFKVRHIVIMINNFLQKFNVMIIFVIFKNVFVTRIKINGFISNRFNKNDREFVFMLSKKIQESISKLVNNKLLIYM